jgi:Mn2+/Fe2+ NRAMP family transporter
MTPRDPYVLDPRAAEQPPQAWLARMRLLGPGLVLTASIVGSGELIATTKLGAEAGYAALWVILVSCAVKVALQLQFGRHTIQTGETCLAAFNRLPGPSWAGANWTIWFWLLIQPIKILQVGGIVGGVAIVLNMVVPSAPTYAWCWIVAVATALLVSSEGYRFVERACVAMIVAFTATTLISVFSLQWTEYAVSGQDVLDGLRFTLPAGSALVALGAFGLTGVGGDEIMQYTYWLIEKGYAAKTGPYDPDDPAWAERARGWIRIMYLDALFSMLVYTVVTAAFYILGAAVLHARGEVPSGDQMVATLANMYTESLGPWARSVFLAGAFVVLYSTLFSALAAWTRVFADAGGILGFYDFSDLAARRRAIKAVAWFFPLAWASIYLIYKDPVDMVMVGGLGTAAILVVVVVGALNFRYRRTIPELTPSKFYDAALWLSVAAIVAVAVYTVQNAVATTG